MAYTSKLRSSRDGCNAAPPPVGCGLNAPAPLVTGLAHVCLKTPDLARLQGFYCGALGLEKAFDFTRRGEVIGFYLRAAPGAFIEVFLDGEIKPGTPPSSLNHFCLEAPDLAPVRARLLAAGHAPGEIKLGCDGSWQFWVNDPDGLALEFHQYTGRSAQRAGGAVEVDW